VQQAGEERGTILTTLGDGGQQFIYNSELLRFHTEIGTLGEEIRKVLVVPQSQEALRSC